MSGVEILYQDKNMIACIKPAGMCSEETPDMPNVVSALKELTGADVKPLHRLDVNVGGVMLFAKGRTAAAKLSALIADGGMKKEYHAVVHGIPEEKSARLEDLLFRDSKKNKTYVVDRPRRGVKSAALEYETCETLETQFGTLSVLHITLITGRSHQIRAQFASRKHPLAGDGRYGARDGIKNICLICKRLSFISPFSGEKMSFENPADVKSLIY